MTVTVEHLERIERARAARDLFPPGCNLDKTFRELARTCHPDIAPKNLRERANKAHQKLSEFKTTLEPSDKIIKIGRWLIQGPFEKGDICDLYLADNDGATLSGTCFLPIASGEPYVLKIARSNNDNDLMQREEKALSQLFKPDGRKEGASFLKYAQMLAEVFTASRRRTHVFPYLKTAVSLEEIVRKMGKLDFRHAVWMFNRLLSFLGYVQRQGIVHGAILPKHLLYRPHDHGMYLVDWCYSANLAVKDDRIPAVVKGCDDFYPKEVRMKRPCLTSDIYMAAKCIEWIGDVPKEFKPVLEHCLAESAYSRPTDPWIVQDRWRAAAKQVYGEPKFVPLVLPGVN